MPSLEQLIQSIDGRIEHLKLRDHIARGRPFGADGKRCRSNRVLHRPVKSAGEETSPAQDGERALDGRDPPSNCWPTATV